MDSLIERTIQDVEMLMHRIHGDLQQENEDDGYDNVEENDEGQEVTQPNPAAHEDTEVNTDTLDQNLETLLTATRALVTSLDKRLTALENSMNSITTVQPSHNGTDGNLPENETAVNTGTRSTTTRVYTQRRTKRIEYVHVADDSFPFDLLGVFSIALNLTTLLLVFVLLIYLLHAGQF